MHLDYTGDSNSNSNTYGGAPPAGGTDYYYGNTNTNNGNAAASGTNGSSADGKILIHPQGKETIGTHTLIVEHYD